MTRRVLALLVMTALALGLIARAENPINLKVPDAKKGARPADAALDPKSTLEEAAIKQERLSRQFRDFEGALLRLAQRLETSSKAEDREKAVVLKKAIDRAMNEGVDTKFDRLVSLLKDSKAITPDYLNRAMTQNQAVADDIRTILAILLTDNRDEELRKEKQRVEQLLRRLNEIISQQKVVRAWTERDMEKARLAREQGQVTKATGELARSMGKGAGDKNNKEAKGENKGEGKKGQAGKGEAKEDTKESKADNKGREAKNAGKPGENKENKGSAKAGEEKENKGQKGDAKPGDGGKENKGGAKAGGKENKGEAKAGDPKKNGDKESKAGSKAGKPGDKAGESKQAGEQKPGEKKDAAQQGDKADSKGKEQNKGESKGAQGGKPQQSGQQAQSKGGQQGGRQQQGQSKGDGQQQGKQQQQDQQQDDQLPGRKQIEDAQGNQKDAEKNIDKNKRPDASKDQDDAIKNLTKAKKQLEELLRQLREEEIERLLAALQQRCERMLAMQIEVRDGTVATDKATQNNADKKPSRTEVQRSLGLADREDEIVREATKAIALLQAEGSAVAFPEVFIQVRGDMEDVAGRLRKTDTAQMTQTIEQDIIDSLKEMIEALKKAQKDQQAKRANPPPPGGKAPDEKLIDIIAELKMIRLRQIRINTRTKLYGNQFAGQEQAPAPAATMPPEQKEKVANTQTKLRELAEQQAKLFEITEDIAKGRNK